jgi:hypothetical protein
MYDPVPQASFDLDQQYPSQSWDLGYATHDPWAGFSQPSPAPFAASLGDQLPPVPFVEQFDAIHLEIPQSSRQQQAPCRPLSNQTSARPLNVGPRCASFMIQAPGTLTVEEKKNIFEYTEAMRPTYNEIVDRLPTFISVMEQILQEVGLLVSVFFHPPYLASIWSTRSFFSFFENQCTLFREHCQGLREGEYCLRASELVRLESQQTGALGIVSHVVDLVQRGSVTGEIE